jgi:hypothetical protein
MTSTKNPSSSDSPLNGKASPRQTPSREAPFAWQSKAALRMISRSERVANRCHALAVYVMLSMVQSDKETGTVTCTKGYLASLAGIGPRSVAQALLDLEALGLVQIERTKVPGTKSNSINSYLLTSCTRCTTSCTGRRDSGARNKNNPSRAKGSLKGEERANTPQGPGASSACAPAPGPGAAGRVGPAFLRAGLDD